MQVAVDPDLARELIRSQFTDVPCESVVPFGAGWDNSCFLVDERWVFRFPKRTDVVSHLLSEVAVLPLLELPLPVPQIRWVGEPSERFAFPFLGYPLLPGVPFTEAEVPIGVILGQILPFIDKLHQTPIVGAVASVRGWEPPFEEALGTLQALSETPVAVRALEWLSERTPPSGRCLVHDDLGPEHILVDPDCGRITGIIDWGDMDLRTPGGDLVGLWAHSPEAVEAAAPDGLYDAQTLAVLYGLFDVRNKQTWGNPRTLAGAIAGVRERLERLGA